ncbi:glycoside hydrolase domain-containing protein [Alicyclobacillus acidoterrestris]|uniref:glycoside hydrolase domain-containing protein n=1 Tax=Alicyclobacillus acidoterrestris TaxID=1450 RepID=UPI001F357BE3|nr:glycoside hydrolase domain-containing protein [Alicyclobacillus acidoterrestris]
MKSAGITHVGRYLGPATNWKTMQQTEAQAILAASLNLWSIWETNPTNASYFSDAQGASDGKTEAAYAQSFGQPKGTAIYHTIDYDVQPDAYSRILEHFQAIKAANTGYKVGVYGPYGVLQYLYQNGAADYYWQTYAWSGGFLVSFAHLYQYQNSVTVAGINVDRDRILLDPGGWQQIMASTLQRGSTGDAVKTLQQELNTVLGIKLTVDGIFGPSTEAAVKSFQQQYHLSVDGIVGPQTEAALKAAYAAKSGTTGKVQQAISLIQQAQSLLKEVE